MNIYLIIFFITLFAASDASSMEYLSFFFFLGAGADLRRINMMIAIRIATATPTIIREFRLPALTLLKKVGAAGAVRFMALAIG
jgi:hypothetical protein